MKREEGKKVKEEEKMKRFASVCFCKSRKLMRVTVVKILLTSTFQKFWVVSYTPCTFTPVVVNGAVSA